jgi:hypothetical protein
MKIGADHDRGLGETLRDGNRSVSEPQGYPAHGEESPYPPPRGGGGCGDVGTWQRWAWERIGVAAGGRGGVGKPPRSPAYACAEGGERRESVLPVVYLLCPESLVGAGYVMNFQILTKS